MPTVRLVEVSATKSDSAKGETNSEEKRLAYTPRVKKFAEDLGYEGSNGYSGVAHAELAGLWRLFRQTGATVPERAGAPHRALRRTLALSIAQRLCGLLATTVALTGGFLPREVTYRQFQMSSPVSGDRVS